MDIHVTNKQTKSIAFFWTQNRVGDFQSVKYVFGKTSMSPSITIDFLLIGDLVAERRGT